MYKYALMYSSLSDSYEEFLNVSIMIWVSFI